MTTLREPRPAKAGVRFDIAAVLETKYCSTCGRTMQWRKAWERNWAAVKYCSQACRAHKPNATDRALEEAIVTTLAGRAHGATMCPSEAARQVGGDQWRELMERARQAARRLVVEQRVEITQGGRVVDPSTAKGPVRIRLTGQ
jgi:hypothetical protein